jgi:hypothetical protein
VLPPPPFPLPPLLLLEQAASPTAATVAMPVARITSETFTTYEPPVVVAWVIQACRPTLGSRIDEMPASA